ncbi:MAG: hypothetical protein IID44_06045 [Planctomycetes bacterium]|nr:hypothetical protein [Planctomycetota bacterium]
MLIVLGAPIPALAQRYAVTDLGAFVSPHTPGSVPSRTEFTSLAINNVGQVVGHNRDGTFIWDAERGQRDLSSLGWPGGSVVDINDSGQVVGAFATGETVSVDFGSFVSDMPIRHAYVWDEQNGLRDIGVRGESWTSSAVDINNSGTVVGTDIWFPAPPMWPSHYFNFRYESTTGMTVRSAGGISVTSGINDRGWTFGTRLPEAGGTSGWLSTSDEYFSIGTLGGNSTAASDLNENGGVVGRSMTGQRDPITGFPEWDAFVWTPESEIAALPGLIDGRSSANAINDLDQIVGRSWISTDTIHAVLWEDGQVRDLNELVVDLTEWDFLATAWGINNGGQIIGIGVIDGQFHNFVLTPVPEPSSLLLGVTAWLLISFSRRRRYHRSEAT